MKQSLKQSRSQSARLSVIAACAVLFMLARAEAAFAQQTASPKPVAAALVGTPADRAVPKPAAETEEPAKPAKPGSEGIKVHGHWKIVVKNPDGTVASATEFENALVTPGGGDNVLAELLSGQLTWGGMDVVVGGNNGCYPGCGLEPGSTLGNLISSKDCYLLSQCFPGLTSTATSANLTATPPTSAFITLQGSFIETTSETLSSVATNLSGCLSSQPSTVTPSACANYYSSTGGVPPSGVTTIVYPFTSKGGIAVSAVPNQVVTIVVTISFS